MDYYIYLERFKNDMSVHINNKKFKVSSTKEFDDLISAYFKEVYNSTK